MTNATLPIEYEVDALHTDPHAHSSTTGIIEQCVAIWSVQCTGRSYTDKNYVETEHIYNCPQGTEDCDSASRSPAQEAENHNPSPLATWTLTMPKKTHL